ETISHLYIDISEELRHLLNTKVSIVVVKPPAINTDSDSDNLSPIFTTEVSTILIESPIIDTDLESTNTQNNPKPHYEKDQNSGYAALRFPLCCANGKIQLPPLFELPPYLLYLYTSTNSDAVRFCKHIRAYNSALAYTSFGANINHQFLGR
ncbi:36428_t:CDS:2, partial [Racocetra persica]